MGFGRVPILFAATMGHGSWSQTQDVPRRVSQQTRPVPPTASAVPVPANQTHKVVSHYREPLQVKPRLHPQTLHCRHPRILGNPLRLPRTRASPLDLLVNHPEILVHGLTNVAPASVLWTADLQELVSAHCRKEENTAQGLER